jgi:hypothetical protein
MPKKQKETLTKEHFVQGLWYDINYEIRTYI